MTFELNTNRLNLPNMVHRQIKENSQPQNVETYFNPLIITGKRKATENQESRRAEMSTSFNSIVASVHSKLRNTQQVYQKVRKLEESKPLLEAEPKKGEFTASKNATEKENPDLGDGGKIKTETKNTNTQKNSKATVLPTNTISIPQIKANRANKQLQRMRRNIPKYSSSPDYGDRVAHQKRIIEVREQKKILEDMLMQHQRLQRDRQSIAMEIHSMREHLSDIRKKLDVSFKRLTTKPIAHSEVLLKPKVFIRPQQTQWSRSPTSSAKLQTLHSILKGSKGGKSSSSSASTKPKSLNHKTKSANNSPVRNKRDTRRTASLPRNTNSTNSAKTAAK